MIPVPRIILATALGLACWLAGRCAGAGEQVGQAEAWLFVRLEAAADFVVADRVELRELVAEGGGEQHPVALLHRVLDRRSLAGGSLLLARAALPPGPVDSLRFLFVTATTDAGGGPRSRRVDPAGRTVAVSRNLRAGDCAVVSLRWAEARGRDADAPYPFTVETLVQPEAPQGARAFVSEPASGCVLVIDRLAGRLAGGFHLGGSPAGLAYADRDQRLYVALRTADAIAVIDGLGLRPERLVSASFGDGPNRLALSPDEDLLYVLNPDSRSLAAFATASMQERARVAVGDAPSGLAVDPETGVVHVACAGEGEVQAFAGGTLAPRSGWRPAAFPAEIAIGTEPRRLFATGPTLNRVVGLDLVQGGEFRGPGLCASASDLAFNPRTGQLFVATPDCREIAVMRPAEGLEFLPLALPEAPGRMAFGPDGRRLFVLLAPSGSLAIFEAHRSDLIDVVEIGGTPDEVLAP